MEVWCAGFAWLQFYHHQGVLTACIPLNLSDNPFLLGSPIDGIQCTHKADGCKFLLVDQHWYVQMQTIGEHCLWICSHFSNTLIIFTLLTGA